MREPPSGTALVVRRGKPFPPQWRIRPEVGDLHRGSASVRAVEHATDTYGDAGVVAADCFVAAGVGKVHPYPAAASPDEGLDANLHVDGGRLLH